MKGTIIFVFFIITLTSSTVSTNSGEIVFESLTPAYSLLSNQIHYYDCSRCLEITTKMALTAYRAYAAFFNECNKLDVWEKCMKRKNHMFIAAGAASYRQYCSNPRTAFDELFCTNSKDAEIDYNPAISIPKTYCSAMGYCASKLDSIKKCRDILFSVVLWHVESGIGDLNSEVVYSLLMERLLDPTISDIRISEKIHESGGKNVIEAIRTHTISQFCESLDF